MTRQTIGKFLLLLCVASGGLTATIALPAFAESEPTAAQPTLPQEKLTIQSANGAHLFTVEKAETPTQQITGEMFRPSVPADQGMLFVWNAPQESDMWMKNTFAPLDIVFIGTDGRISSITENAVPQSLARISSHGPVLATLELQAGITEKLGIVVGDRVTSSSLDAKKPKQAASAADMSVKMP